MMTLAKRPYAKPTLKKSLILQSVTAQTAGSTPPDDDTIVDIGYQT